jgi:hypothetical protein
VADETTQAAAKSAGDLFGIVTLIGLSIAGAAKVLWAFVEKALDRSREDLKAEQVAHGVTREELRALRAAHAAEVAELRKLKDQEIDGLRQRLEAALVELAEARALTDEEVSDAGR